MPGYVRMGQIQSLVLKLVDKKVALDKAESLVGEAMEYLDKDFKQTQAQGIETLGIVHLAKGDTKRAEKELTDAFATNNTLTRAPVELAQLEAKRGNDRAVLTYLMPLSASGKLKAADEDMLRASYKKIHNGSLASFDADVDKIYLEKFPNPIKTVETYKATAARTNRVVLAEMFTGAGCGPCVSADLALDKVAERYADADVITLAYHANIPLPDPMVIAGGEVRRNYYKVNGVPTIEVDGTGKVGGGGREQAPRTYADYVTMVDKALETSPSANVTVRATTDGTKINITATASSVKSDAKDLKLQVVLAEHELRFVGENGIRFHSMVVRGVAGENQGGFAVNASGETTAEWTFDLAAIGDDLTKTLAAEITKRRATETPGSTPREYRADGHAMVTIDPSSLSVVAFVQETKGEGTAQTRQVLQAAQAAVVK
jgi:thiol-disulfide isomerase/thioredoxin